MAIAFRSLVRVTEGSKRSFSRNYMIKNAFGTQVNYRISPALLEDRYVHPRRMTANKQSSQLRKFQTASVLKAEIVKFHLSDIGMNFNVP